jgi:HD-like signal output (HDOD) protein
VPRWLRSPVATGNSLSAKKALSGLSSAPDTAESDPARSGIVLLESSHVETQELGPLAKVPAFAPVVIKLLRLFDRDNVEQAEITRLVAADTALTGEILGVVNSPLYAVRVKISDPGHGVAMLGVSQMKALATALALRALLSGSPKTAIVRRFWKHSVASAAIAQELAPWFEVDRGAGYVAAILHDLGRIGLLAAYGDAYGDLATNAHQSVEEILSIEQERFGMDHCAAGLLLSKAWGLPDLLQGCIADHHRQETAPGVLGLIQLSCRLADAFMFQSIFYRNRLSAADTIQPFLPAGLTEEPTAVLERMELAAFQTIESFDF